MSSLRSSKSVPSRHSDHPWRISTRLTDRHNNSASAAAELSVDNSRASQLVHLLQVGQVHLTGGRDKRGGPILLFPSDSRPDVLPEQDLAACISYLAQLPSSEASSRGFTIIIDNRRGTFTSSDNKKLISTVEEALRGAVHAVYIVQTERQKLTQSFRRERPHFRFPVHYVTLSKLLEVCSPAQLTTEFGGTLPYSHEQWLQNRLLIEEYTADVDMMRWELDRLHSHLVDTLDTNDKSAVRKFFDVQMNDGNSLLNRARPLIERGRNLERRLQVEAELAYHSRDIDQYSPDHLLAVSQVRQRVQLMESTLARFDALHRESMVEIIWKRQLTELEQAMKTVVEWILGPAEKLLASQTEIGDSFQAADELRKQHEQLELKCTDSYGTYAELRHKVTEVINSGNSDAEKVADLEAQREYMDMVFRSFAGRLERRRNLVITSVRYHRLVEQLSADLDTLLDWLLTDVIADDVTSAEASLQELDEKCRVLGKISSSCVK